MYDAVIIGAGVVGSMIARELSKYELKICLVEKENDVSKGATKANSAIIHAGFDAPEGSLKAKLNVRGSEMMKNVADELGVKYHNNGSLVVGFDEDDLKHIAELYDRGCKNGVKKLEIVGNERLKELEPNISDKAIGALYAPTGAIICPYELCIAAAGNAMDNGAELKVNFEVNAINKTEYGYEVVSASESLQTRVVINAAGVYADSVARMVGDNSFSIKPRRGEYILLDKECGSLAKQTIFRTPGRMGKGILVSPTVDGNLLLGPTSVDIEDKTDTSTTRSGFDKIIAEANYNLNILPLKSAITSFCGLRATGSTGDFIIGFPQKGFLNVAGIESPGLSASPAIAEHVAELLKNEGYVMKPKSSFNPYRKPMHYFKSASIEEKNEIIRRDKTFGKIVCRCESVTVGEILEAIRTNPRPADLDGVKRRTRAQMGRCQGGFCMPYITELLAKENNIPLEKVTKSGGESYVLVGKSKF